MKRTQWVARLVLFFCALYMFLVAIELFGQSSKIVGSDTASWLLNGVANPFAGLAVGILATVLVQSSSVTTSSIVAMVGSGALPLEYAVPMVMGANVGTSVTNTVVSLGHVTRDSEFRRAFAGATVHDIFNLLTVLLLLPLELCTGFLQKGAAMLVHPLQGIGGEFHSPIKASVKLPVLWICGIMRDTCGLNGGWLSLVLLIIALVLILGSLYVITKNMRALMADQIEEWLNSVLRRSGLLGLGIGALATAAVQSSSITTSLLVPMFGAGVLAIEAGFPIMLGANIGTTITALLAATVTGPAGLSIALIHLLFNLTGTLILFPIKAIRRIPIYLAQLLAEVATKNRVWVLVYTFGVFVLMPVVGILVWKT